MLSHPGLGNGVALRIRALPALLCALLFALGCQLGGGGHGGGGGGGNGGSGGGPAYTATVTHKGNFTQGQQNATYTITLTNIGGNFVSNNGNAFLAFIEEELPAGLTLVSMAGTGWTCNIVPTPPSTLPGCSTNNPIAAGASAPQITVTVNVAPNATSPQINQVIYPGPATSATVSDSTTILPAGGGPAVVSTSVGNFPPLFAGEIFPGNSPSITIDITVTNDAPGDAVTAGLTVDGNTTFNCTMATCGLLSSVTGTPGAGSYTVSYTPPPSSPSFIQTFPTLVVNSNLPGAVGSTDFIEVDPAGILVQVFPPNRGGEVYVGVSPADTRNLTVFIYNDALHAAVNFEPLTSAGYSCGALTTNQCGTLGTPSGLTQSTDPTTGVLVDTLTIPYTAPAALPSAPYNTPLVLAISLADGTRSGSAAFLLANTPTPGTLPPMWIFKNTKFKSAALGSANAATVSARIANDTGVLKTVNWMLTSGGPPPVGVNCSPQCGMLGSPTVTVNGAIVDATITYTPPATLPAGASNTTYTITAASADTPPGGNDSFTFNIFDPTCGTGHESVLNGQYAFLVRGATAPGGYVADIGSFTADGAGHITAGQQDGNTSGFGPFLGATLLTTPSGQLPASSYTVGSDNRGCLTLADSTGAVYMFRFAVGTLDASSHATKGRIIRFDDASWRGRSESGIILKQDPASFAANQFSGNYAFGLTGVSFGGRDSVAGVLSSNGSGSITSINEDEDLANSGPAANRTGSGSYSLATNAPSGRGTATTTIGLEVNHYVIYMVSSSEILAMTTDNVDTSQTITLPILTGELRKQTGTPFAPTALDGKDYVFYVEGVHPGDGGNDTVIGQATFASNGNATITLDENKSGAEQMTQTAPNALFTIAANGRTTISNAGPGSTPIIYLIDSTSAFIVGTSSGAESGFVEQQTINPATVTNASLSGQFFLGTEAPTTESGYQSGTATLNGTGGATGSLDHSGPGGLGTDSFSPTMNGGTYSFPSPAGNTIGKGTVGTNMIGYVVSGSKAILMDTTPSTTQPKPHIAIVEK